MMIYYSTCDISIDNLPKSAGA